MKNINSSCTLKLKRVLIILCAIKDKGRIGTKELNEYLASLGINASIRTTQRDLKLMQELGLPLYGDDCKPQGWRIDSKNPLAEVVELLEAA